MVIDSQLRIPRMVIRMHNTFVNLFAIALSLLLAVALSIASDADSPATVSIQVYPKAIQLNSPRDQQSLIVIATYADGSTEDVTSECTVEAHPNHLVQYLSETVIPGHNGSGELIVQYAGHQLAVPTKVSGSDSQPKIEFRNEVLQVLTKAGCNTGKCHGSATGKDGFRLSLFGYDPQGDHYRLTRELNGRRIHWNQPEKSLLLLKATGSVDHTGGGPIAENTYAHEILLQWLAEGCSNDEPATARVPKEIRVYPEQAVFSQPGGSQKLIAVARYSDGSEQDVTARAVFISNNESAASVDESGMVVSRGTGVAFVLARFDQFTSGASIIVRSGSDFHYPDAPALTRIDELVDKRLQFLHMSPSDLATDEQFLRRSSLDLVGLLPTESQYAEFVQDTSKDKRTRWINRLIDRPEFHDQWVMHWAELLQIRTNNGVSPKALRLYDQWLRTAVHRGETIDNIVKNILAANGGTLENPATNYFQTETTPQLMAENVAQVFLGTRIQCAQCHNHPFDRWTMDDYYGFASFFSQIGYKQGEDPRELTIYNMAQGQIEHPLGKKDLKPRFLGAELPAMVDGKDYREVLADWLTSPENKSFARNIANIVWAHFMGVGIIDPVDDVRISNPATNLELLDYLAERLVEEKFELKPLIREICNSRTYQTATRRNESNKLDEKEFSHQKIRRMRAEVLLDCICQVTETTERLPGLPKGSRAVQVADGQAAHYFLTTFGRSNRSLACTCETKTSPTLSQALHLLNSETTGGKIREGATVSRWLQNGLSPHEIARQITVRCLSREPSAEELKQIDATTTKDSDPQLALEDFFWAVLNSNEFVFNH